MVDGRLAVLDPCRRVVANGVDGHDGQVLAVGVGGLCAPPVGREASIFVLDRLKPGDRPLYGLRGRIFARGDQG